jgi:hypothetical protein
MLRPSDELVFAPLGGVGDHESRDYGFATERHRQWIAVDLGVAFGDDTLPGADLILPDIRYLIEQRASARPRAHPRPRGPFRVRCRSVAQAEAAGGCDAVLPPR